MYSPWLSFFSGSFSGECPSADWQLTCISEICLIQNLQFGKNVMIHTPNVLEFDLVNQVDSGRNLVNQVRQPGKPGLGEACKVIMTSRRGLEPHVQCKFGLGRAVSGAACVPNHLISTPIGGHCDYIV